MTKQLNIIEALSMPVGTKFKITHSMDSKFIGEKVVIREFGLRNVKTLYHINDRGSENKLAATEMMVTTKFEEYQEVEYLPTDFTALASSNNRKVYIKECGSYRELSVYKDFQDFGVYDTDDLRRTAFYEKKVNGVFETK
ncbi:hypothetical protein CN613_25590 [Bacillus pseudomycoides]|uniref:Uncharacterized protein n=1 Tax=Bacillus pseudomycoides TaxID=64104 RepID=A0A2A8BYW5_9BACI|nr:hypothetical protein [Bacillus pseudomycoides]PEM65320.1 hypothetical protein CN613_25590 [Bacillus pseudomycoides]